MSNKTVGFRLEFQGAQSTVDQLLDVEIATGKITARLKELKKEGGLEKNVEEARKLKLEQRALQEQSKDLRKEQQQLINEYKKSKFPKDSLVGMREEYNKLTREVERLDAAQRNSKEWTKKIREINELNNKIKQVESSMGNFRRNVGNYPGGGVLGQGIKGVAQASLGPAAALMSGPLAAGVFAGGVVLSQYNEIKKFEQAIADLGAISGAAGKELESLKKQSKDLGQSTAFSAVQVVDLQTELSKLGFVTSEILQMTKAVIDFGIAVDADAGRAASLAGAALRTFGKDVSQIEEVLGAMAKQTLIAASDFSTLETQLPIVGAVAKSFGFSLEDTLALLAELSNRGFDASMSATALRNIFLHLADANGKLAKAIGGPAKTLPDLIHKLKKLDETGIDLAQTLELTDKRSVAAFNSFLDGADSVFTTRKELEKVDGVIAEMNEKRLDTLTGKLTLLSSAWKGLGHEIDSGNGYLSRFFKFMADDTAKFLTGLTALSEGLGNYTRNFNEWWGVYAGNPETLKKIRRRKEITDGIDPFSFLTSSIDQVKDSKSQIEQYTRLLDETDNKIRNLESERTFIPSPEEIKRNETILKLTEQRATVQKRLNQLYAEGAAPTKNTFKLPNSDKQTKEAIKGSIGFLEKELTEAKKKLSDFTPFMDEAAVAKALANIKSVEGQIEEAKKRLRTVDEINLENEIQCIEEGKAARLAALSSAGLEHEDFVSRMVELERRSDILILQAKIEFAKQGSKEREKLEEELQKKLLEGELKTVKDAQDARKSTLTSFLSEHDNDLARKLTATNQSFIPQFESADTNISNAKDEKSYKSAVDAKHRLEKQFQNEVLRLTKETELAKIDLMLQYTEEGSAEYYQLLYKKSQIEIELTKMQVSEIDRIKEEGFKKEADRQERIRQLRLQTIEFLGQAADTLFNHETELAERAKEQKIKALDEEYDHKFKAAEGNAALEKRLEKEKEAERLKIDKAAFEKKKSIAVQEVIIDGILAVAKMFAQSGWGGIAGAAFIAGQTAIQIAAINAQKFNKGGKVKRLNPGKIRDLPNVMPTPEGDNILGLVKANEVILTERQQALLGGPEVFANIGVPGFSKGGKVPHYFYYNSTVPTYNQGGRVRSFDYTIPPDALISPRATVSNSNLSISDDQLMRQADLIASRVTNALLQHLPAALYQAVKEGTFQGLNDDKRLKEREASANLNANY